MYLKSGIKKMDVRLNLKQVLKNQKNHVLIFQESFARHIIITEKVVQVKLRFNATENIFLKCLVKYM